MADGSDLRFLFQPRQVAVIGASRTPGKIGHAVVRNLKAGGFAGAIYPVNPAGGEVEGVPCLRSVADLPEPADCAITVVPAAQTVEAVRACAEKGVRAAVVGAGGFAEAGTPEGRQRQAELLAIARASGMRLLGPNTNGIYNRSAKLSLGYNAAHGYAMPPGPVSVIAHSGAVFGGVALTLMSFGVGLSKFVPVGNEADIDMLDVLDYCIEDADTRVIGLVIEALSDGPRLRELAERAAGRGKPIVALKIGRSQVGVSAALAHSSRLAGAARAYDALFDACAIASVRSVEALAAGCALLAQRSPGACDSDRRVICVTTSGAGGAVLADFAAERGIALAGSPVGEWEGDAGATIARLPARGKIRSPIDLGVLDDWSILSKIYAALEADGLDGPTVAYVHIAPTPDMDEKLVSELAARRQRSPAPIVAVAPGGLGDLEQAYRAHGIALFRDTALCFDSLACHFATCRTGPAMWARSHAVSPAASKAVARLRALADGRTMLSEVESAEILRMIGVPLVESRSADTLAQARAGAAELGYPLVLKALAGGVAHKNAAGFVITAIGGIAELERAHVQLLSRAKGHELGALTLVLQPMVSAKWELLVGISRQAQLGHFVIFGLGGVDAELLDEVVLVPIDLDVAAMRQQIARHRIGSRLAGTFNRSHQCVLDGIMTVVAGLQQLAWAGGDIVDSIDLNPIIVTKDHELVAVDALIVFQRAPESP
ncbi:MAG TPA: acetate--CoA ligase family protein [Xanthobacteraceae bacterium]